MSEGCRVLLYSNNQGHHLVFPEAKDHLESEEKKSSPSPFDIACPKFLLLQALYSAYLSFTSESVKDRQALSSQAQQKLAKYFKFELSLGC